MSLDTLSSTMRTFIGGEEVSKYKDGDEQFSVQLRLDDQFRNNPATMGDLFVPASGGRMVRVSDVAKLTLGNAPASIDRYNRMRQVTVNANLDRLKITLGRRDRPGAQESRRTGAEGGLSGDVRRQRPNAQRSGQRLPDRDSPGGRLHLHGARVAVQQLHPPAHDHDGAAAQPAGRAPGAHGVRHDDQRLQRDRPDDAVRDRQEELDPAGGLHQHAARRRGWTGTPPSFRRTTCGCGRS